MKPILAAALLAVLLVGCDPIPPVPTPSATPTVEDSASPEPTETVAPEPAVQPTLSELILSPEGVGPIVLGQPVPAADPAVAVVTWSDDFCDFGTSYGNWKPNYPMTPDGKWPFLAEVTYDSGTPTSPVIHMNVQSTEVRTIDGLGIGSTLAQLQAAYPDDLNYIPGENYVAYSVAGSYGQLLFWMEFSSPSTVAVIELVSGYEAPEFSYHVSGCA